MLFQEGRPTPAGATRDDAQLWLAKSITARKLQVTLRELNESCRHFSFLRLNIPRLRNDREVDEGMSKVHEKGGWRGEKKSETFDSSIVE